MTRTKRPRREWLLLIGFALLSLGGWQRLAASQASGYWLDKAGAAPGTLYLSVSGAVWGLVALLAAIWLLLRARGYRLVCLAAAVFLLLTYWVDRLWFGRADGPGANLVFAMLASLLALGFVMWALHLWRKEPSAVGQESA